MMSGLRALVRERVPLSSEIYELARVRRRSRKTPAKIREILRAGHPIMLDLGGADAGRNGWKSIDVTQQCDLFWDLSRGIPFPDESVDRIYSSHLFEHLTYDQGQELLRESLRVLKPGGSFSICVPNARIYIEHYLGIQSVPDDYFGWRPAFNATTVIDAVNYVAYMDGEHKYMFDQENLLHLLGQAGFAQVQARSIDPGVDRPERDYESIYASAIKPVR